LGLLMTRIVSYNILAGGYNIREAGVRRSAQIIAMLRSVQPDVVGLVEAIHPEIKQTPSVLEEIAQELHMQVVPGSTRCTEYPLALLTRLPIVGTKIYERPGILARPLLEVCVEEENGEHLTVYVTHLSASFNRGRAGGAVRLREVAEILRITAPLRAEGKPHLIMGDCNSLAPGDAFKASALLRYVARMDPASLGATYDGHPNFNSVVPPRLRFLQPLLNLIASSDMLGSLFNMAAYLYAPRGCIRDLKRLYVDSYRHIHPYKQGFTCPAAAPAGRIDYIFASSPLAERLTDCDVLRTGADGINGDQASDHLPIIAEFGLRVASGAADTVLAVDKADNVMVD
jgi:endonuclease/exonuclease/phosphatase family metal-dependent hydrolase